MPIEAMMVIAIILLILVAALCVAMLYRAQSGGSAISPVLDQRLLALEGTIARPDPTHRRPFGRGRDGTRESARSLREEVTTLFGSLSTSLRGSLADLATGQNTRLEDFSGRLTEARAAAA